jgi:hypothetical protein
MPEDLNALLNAYLDGRLGDAQRAKLLLRLKAPAVARRLERLRSLRLDLRAAMPEPSPEQSRRMWAAISSKLPAAAKALAEAPLPLDPPPAREPWYSFFTRPWMPAAGGLGLAGALALAWVFLLNPRSSAPIAGVSPAAPPVPQAASPALAQSGPKIMGPGGGQASEAQARPGPASAAPVLAAARKQAEAVQPARELPAPVAAPALAALSSANTESSPAGVTEVERALADNQVNDLIDQFLTVQKQAPAAVVAGMPPAEAQPSGLGMGGAESVDYQSPAVPVAQEDLGASGAPGPVQGGEDAHGFWNWNPAAQALNQRDWAQARVELRAALDGAGEASERAFAGSALNLLSAPGGPLEGSQPLLSPVGDLRVLSAGTWQLLVGSRLARFGGGVSVRLPGLREDGDSFLLDLTFDRGEFAPGAHFVRVSGEAPVRVFDAAKQPVSSNDFYAPAGADYDIADQVLRLR